MVQLLRVLVVVVHKSEPCCGLFGSGTETRYIQEYIELAKLAWYAPGYQLCTALCYTFL